MENTVAAAPHSIDICVCTYRRSSLVNTLSSLFRLNLTPGWTVRIIVADNDDTQSAGHIINNAKIASPFPIHYIHAPARNISVARNACLDAATAELVAFIDDDEMAGLDWLKAMIGQQAKTGAEIILGPVESRYPTRCPAWIRRENLHAIKPVWVNGTIITGYTSNVLFVRGAKPLAGLRFDTKLGRTGGEDTVFFATAYKAGARIDYAPEAYITENVTSNRLGFWWLARRFFRSGQTHAVMLMEKGNDLKTRMRSIVIASAKALFCLTAALISLVSRGRTHYWLLRGSLHVGVVAKLLGVTELVQYG